MIEKYHLEKLASKPHTAVVPFCGKIEAELAELPDAEAAEMMRAYGLTESGRDRLIQASYRLLGLISFLTCGEPECRAWTIERGMNAQKAAGAIHSDIERGFIKAEVVNWEDLLKAGSFAAAREKAQVRLEGKEYIVQDGDVILFRHSGDAVVIADAIACRDKSEIRLLHGAAAGADGGGGESAGRVADRAPAVVAALPEIFHRAGRGIHAGDGAAGNDSGVGEAARRSTRRFSFTIRTRFLCLSSRDISWCIFSSIRWRRIFILAKRRTTKKCRTRMRVMRRCWAW